MDTNQFWKIVRSAYLPEDQGSNREWFASLKDRLLELPPEQILEFGRLFHAKIDAAYRTDLWGAAYLINGGCSDDGFHAFRNWLVGMGKDVYEKALKNADSLADVLHGQSHLWSDLDSAAARAWEQKTGRTTDEFYAALDALGKHLGRSDSGRAGEQEDEDEDEGEDWDFDDDEELRRRLPRLSRVYLTESEE